MFIQKPWGSEQILERNDNYVVKLLKMNSGHKCSIQYHEKKVETVYIISGRLRIYHGHCVDSLTAKDYYANEFITLQNMVVHRMEAIEDSIYLEASTPELDDVIRLQDDYNRA
jgi:mannose-6-phosphate isomerase